MSEPEKFDDQGRRVTEPESFADRQRRHARMHPDHVANEVIGVPRGPDTAHLYRIFEHFHGQLTAQQSQPAARRG